MEIKWTPITEEYPLMDTEVFFCCKIDSLFTRINKGRYQGLKTEGGTAVMETDDDWSPCSHWMPMFPTPDLMPTPKQNSDDKLPVNLVAAWIEGETEYPGDMTIVAAMNTNILMCHIQRHYGSNSKASKELDNIHRLIFELRKYFNL